FRKAIAVCILSILANGSAWSNAAPPGFVEGHLNIASLGAVEPSDAMPRQTVTAENYTEYPLIILNQDGKNEVARIIADKNGNYRAALRPGNYILDVQDRAAKRLQRETAAVLHCLEPNRSRRYERHHWFSLRAPLHSSHHTADPR